LVAAIAAREADGGLLIGNASSRAATLGIKFWGTGGRPLSSPGDLDVLRGAWETGADRPTRSYGGLDRFDAQAAYLAGLRAYFHALRPLRFVLATSCGPLLGYLKTLLATTACELLTGTMNLPRDVRTHHGHFGLWIDGDGEACRLVDERGREIGTDAFVALLASARGGQDATGTQGGQLVFGDRPGAGDALRALALLLTILSASDRPLSAVLETVLPTTA
jgi:phosphomannomutase